MIIGATLQAASFGLPQFIVGRLITGFGNGMNTSTYVFLAQGIGKPYLTGSQGTDLASRNLEISQARSNGYD
jgi:TM2 domain-containing membrane protein YozV